MFQLDKGAWAVIGAVAGVAGAALAMKKPSVTVYALGAAAGGVGAGLAYHLMSTRGQAGAQTATAGVGAPPIPTNGPGMFEASAFGSSNG